jgi:hypothetical protein
MITLVERSYMGPVEGRAISREPASYILRGFYLPPRGIGRAEHN